MTFDHVSNFMQENGKDVPQFASNFSVYVLPPDVVCLYSEDRKSFFTANFIAPSPPRSGKAE